MGPSTPPPPGKPQMSPLAGYLWVCAYYYDLCLIFVLTIMIMFIGEKKTALGII